MTRFGCNLVYILIMSHSISAYQDERPHPRQPRQSADFLTLVVEHACGAKTSLVSRQKLGKHNLTRLCLLKAEAVLFNVGNICIRFRRSRMVSPLDFDTCVIGLLIEDSDVVQCVEVLSFQ